MADTQTHIVYRNRVEHDFYESGMMVPLVGGLVGVPGACGTVRAHHPSVEHRQTR